MRRFMYVLFGLVLAGAAIAMVAYRQFDITPDSFREMIARDEPAAQTRSAEPGLERQDRAAFREARRAERQQQRQWRGNNGQWRIAEIMLDSLNAVIGLVGIFLAFRAGRGQRQTMA